ncbi:glycolipid transfer protein-like [Dorcoceras hygrometricum]|uniref:Glycolipid transfer protein-like n=1 Tax=Dorcoceras hygrometricum TaxID=472368 RepID=A0A2Z7AYK4_9LAMI|nr:glycolipid transfer protein-like [Dorcoceras hygrometricum]
MAIKFGSFFSRTERLCTEKMEQGSARNSKDGDDDFEDVASELTPLSAMADSFEELAALVKSKGFSYDLDLKTFCDACSLVSVLFGCLGIAFKFAELEYVSKVSDLTEAAASYATLNNILDIDVLNDTVRTTGSLSRNLRRVRQGLDLIRALFQNFLSSDYYCLKDAASEAYTTTCAMYHTWAIRTAVYAGMYALPTRDQLLFKLNETEESAEREMQRYIDASLPIIEYIDNLYISRNTSLDW